MFANSWSQHCYKPGHLLRTHTQQSGEKSCKNSESRAAPVEGWLFPGKYKNYFRSLICSSEEYYVFKQLQILQKTFNIDCLLMKVKVFTPTSNLRLKIEFLNVGYRVK